jgi:UDP-sulfoquinovose synthase
MLPNPRREAAENDLVVRNDRFLALGLNPTTLSEGLLEEVRLIASKYRDRVDPSKIVSRSVWRKGMEVAPDLQVVVPAQIGENGKAEDPGSDELVAGNGTTTSRRTRRS